MTRNKKFHRKYTIEVTGITTNRFMERFLDSWIGRTVLAAANRFAQLEIVTMTAEEVETSKKLREVHHCPKCGAMKYTEGSDCLFCAAEEDHANSKI